MWIRGTLKFVLGGYLAYFLFLLLTIYCLPLTINDVVSLPFHAPVISAHRLGLNLGTVLLMLMVLTFCHEQQRFRRLFAIRRRSRPLVELAPEIRALPRKHFGTIFVLLIAVIGAPTYVSLQSRHKTANALLLDDLEVETHERITALARPLTRLKTKPSPDRQWDSLPYTRLPVMNLEIPQFSRFELNKVTPRWQDGFNSDTTFSIFAKGTEYWPYVPAFFNHGGKRYPVDIRYRGWNFDHYLGFKKSWRIKFRKNDLFHGRRQFNVINQRDHSALNDFLWSEALRESGIMTPYQFPVHFRINGEFRGLQTFLEQPDQHFAERHNRNASDLFGETEPVVLVRQFLEAKYWQQYARAGLSNDLTPVFQLYRAALTKDWPEYLARIEQLLDTDHYLKYLAHATISCSENPSSHNIRWIRDPGVGRFQIVPWYQASSLFIIDGHYELWKKKGWNIHPVGAAINDFADGLLRHRHYRDMYLRHMWRMLQSTHHPDHLMRKLDELYAHVRSDARADTHKHYRFDMQRYISTDEWEATIQRLREMIPDRLRYLSRQLSGGPIKVTVQPDSDPTSRQVARLALVTTNYVSSRLRQIKLRVPSTWRGRKLTISHQAQPLATAPVKTSPQGDVATFSLGVDLHAKFRRRGVLLGPGIIISDLGAAKNPEMDFLGGVSRITPHYRPHAATNHFVITAGPEGLLPGESRLDAIELTNLITGKRVPTSLDRDTTTRLPDHSEAAAYELQSLPVPNPRRPEDLGAAIEPDGVSLGDARVAANQILTLPAKTHSFTTNLIISPYALLHIQPGATLRFAPGTSLIVRGGLIAEGMPDRPIRFTSQEGRDNWGVLFLNSNQRFTNHLSHCVFERSANVMINGMAVTAGLAAYSAPVEINNCVFREMSADDAFNSKYVSPKIASCVFSNNHDAIDIDMGGGSVTDCLFINNRDDCIDLSSAWAVIERNRIHSHGDKGISVGEKSQPTIFNNLITHAAMGIAVKDLSGALILNNSIISNQTAVALYQKKISFGPATASLVNNFLHYNDRIITTDPGSSATARFNSAAAQLSGKGNITATEPARLRTAGSARPASYYGLADANVLRQIGSF